MKINVNGNVEDIDLVFGIADNKPTNNTYEVVENFFTGSRDDDGNMIVKEDDFKLLKKIEEELKKNNQFSFELSYMYDLKELYNKIVNENKERKVMANNRLANVVGKAMKKQASSKKLDKVAKAKYTQRQLKDMVAEGLATDITTWDYNKVYNLMKEEQLEPIGSSYGVYGPNGRLYRGKSGKIYAVTARNNTLDQLPW